MKQNKIYLDTSVLNFFYEKNDLEKANSTKELFREINKNKFLAFISDLVLREVKEAHASKKQKLLSLIKTYQLARLETTLECMTLTETYLEKNIFPSKYRDDALHIAIASVYDIDVVISWNLEHMVKLKTRREVRAINILEGYKEIEICTPLEVIEND
jgi:predicted nucleic acid-binding protein